MPRDRAPARSPSGARARPARRDSGQRSGRGSPSKSGAAPLSAMQPVLSPIARISATSSAVRTGARERGRARRAWPRSGAPSASWIRVGATHAHRLLGEVPGAGELEHRQAVARRRSGACAPSRSRPALDPALRAERAVVVRGELVPREDVVVEQAAVVDDAGDQPHAVAPGGGEHQLARPRLERVEDHHRPVDQLAEALEAVDDVEREAVGRARGDAERRREARPSRTAVERRPDRRARVAGAVGVVQQQHVEARRRRSARGCARPPCARSPRSASGPRRRGSVKRGKPFAPSRSPLVEVVADRADQAVVVARDALQRAAEQRVGLARRRRRRR